MTDAAQGAPKSINPKSLTLATSVKVISWNKMRTTQRGVRLHTRVLVKFQVYIARWIIMVEG